MNLGRHCALFLLTWLGFKGRIRQIGRAFRTVRGVIAFVFGFLMFAGWLGMSFVGLFLRDDNDHSPSRAILDQFPPGNFQLYIALTLLGYCLVTFLFRNPHAGIQFRPAEVDFLFAGPYHRRDLILHKIVKLLGSVLFTALIFACVISWMPVPFPILFMGIFLAIAFAILVNMLAAMLALSLSARIYSRTVRLGAAIVLLTAAAAAYQSLQQFEWSEAAQRGLALAQSPAGKVVLAPFMVFARAVTAPDFAAFALHGSAAMIVNLIVVAGIVLLDADYYEASIDASRKTHERLKRIRQGDVFITGAARGGARSLPELPRWSGVGPVAWRQATTAVRSLPRILLVLVLFVAPGAALTMRNDDQQEMVVWGLRYLAIMLFIFMPAAFRFDFRSDLNKLSWLKALPVSSWAIVIGQLLPATLILVVTESLLLTVIAISAENWVYLALIPLLPAAAFNVFAVENLVFLLFPTRRFAMYPGDFQNLGYTYLVAMAKFFVLGLVFGAAAAAAALMMYLIELPIAVVSTITALFLLTVAIAWVPLIAWVYDRFDPSTDVPME